MKSRKPVIYFVVLLAVFASLELAVRRYEQSLLSVQNKVLLKKQMVLLRRPTHVLFLGTSRTQDGVEPRELMKSMARIDPDAEDVEIFNAAATASNMDSLKHFVENILCKEGLKLLVIEVSDPQMMNGPLASELDEASAPKHTEAHLQKCLRDNSYLVRHRKLFRLDSFRRIPTLWMSDFSVGTELFRRALLKDMVEKIDRDALAQEAGTGRWKPEAIPPADKLSELTLSEPQIKAVQVYTEIVAVARRSHVDVLFMIPPLRGEWAAKEFDPHHQVFYQTLSFETGRPVLTTAARELNPRFFRDDSHLNKMGRTLWSDQLAGAIVHTLQKREGE
ncbi:MAG: hypothetical protein HN919_10215 [Verrucomicrobia bacterium]|nr:hypothetical protein [Verrucomicrobiota bacterium]MBT7066666.1 hypothetical protein [Verrucomicrobiota bacterium]MBT7701601.1 hypothetical protein [Verrucomicrobiota bacterium]